MSTERIGYRVIEQIPRVEPDLLAHAARYSAPELCDGEIVYNAMDYHIKPMVTQKKIVGQAVTLKLTLGDSLMVTKAMSVCRPGDVLVIDGRGSGNNAVWGDQRSLTAKLLGLGGVVIDGAFRDIDENEEIGFPIYARAVTCGCSTKNSHGEVNVPISCGGGRSSGRYHRRRPQWRGRRPPCFCRADHCQRAGEGREGGTPQSRDQGLRKGHP